MTHAERIATMKTKLESLGIGYETLKVYGTIGCNVIITCKSMKTAQKWQSILMTIFAGAKVSLVPTIWEAKENKGTVLRPTMIDGYLIGVRV